VADARKRFVSKALFAGIIVFAVLHLIMIVLMNQTEPIAIGSAFWHQVLSLIVAGYVAGFVAKNDGLSHGALVGACAPLILAIGAAIATSKMSAVLQMLGLLGVMWVVQSVVCCGLGGFIWDVQSKFRGSAP
jgi:predicted MFS family arabinose efflux permease